MEKVRALLEKYLKNSLSDQQIDLLDQYVSLILKWNKFYNLTAITDPQEIVIKHILDSLSVLPYLKGDRILDVGTGAGFPGIPLAISLPNKHFSLLDSSNKKIQFLIHIVSMLHLKNIEIIHSRVESYQNQQGFNTIITRAFSDLPHFLKTTQHLIGPHGIFIAMRGVTLSTIQTPDGFQIKDIISLRIPDLSAERHVVIVESRSS
ncbi:MAG: 16S rRNA (guanine(527)-N(7))-methyltransferase RsmG [Gammaproteobacteria bacterium]|nr:16S rRNA (guanine(527)-N(7))-methyltransferase RsmG [Gammaproteobacteria bacterium]